MKKRIVQLGIITALLIAAVLILNYYLGQAKLDSHITSGKPLLVKLYDGNDEVSFRGIDCIADTVIWVSGSGGVFGKSLDAGKHWVFGKINNADSLELRDIYLFDAQTALVLGAGYPTRVFKTRDGGQSWQVVYANNNPNMFLDGFDFWEDGEGLAFGDPLDERLIILRTTDFGDAWFEDSISSIAAIDGEAGFAASGSSIQCWGDSAVMIGTGGTVSRFHFSMDRGKTWQSTMSPLEAGSPSQGIFSVHVAFGWQVAVGGDYAVDTATHGTVAVKLDETNGWVLKKRLPFQSAVKILNDSVAVSIGTPGAYVTLNKGETWELFSKDGMHCLAKNKDGKTIYTAGPKGRIAKIVFDEMK